MADTYQVAIRREDMGRGGSSHIHDTVTAGAELRLRGPSNLFRLSEGSSHCTLVAGGIGITPIIAMADRLKADGRSYDLHYAGRSRRTMAFLPRLQADHGDRLNLYPKDEGRRLDLASLVSDLPAGGQIYSCGPARMLLALEELTAHLPEGTLRFEHFSSGGSGLDPSKEQAFEAELTDSGMTVRVDADKTLLDALLAVGIDVPHDCCEGLCGSCEVAVVEGEVDHRDMVLTRAERARNDRMMSCCSRARDGGRIRLAL